MTKLIFGGLAGVMLVSSCTPYQQQGAGLGALGGAAVGALAGDDRGDVAAGAVIGAALGTGIAASQENARRRQSPPPDQDYYNGDGGSYREERYEQRPQQTQRQEYPYAERTSNPDRVLSPYSPYNVINVEGFRSGQLAKDPSNGKIFRVP